MFFYIHPRLMVCQMFLLEATEAGLPIVASNDGEVNELVKKR